MFYALIAAVLVGAVTAIEYAVSRGDLIHDLKVNEKAFSGALAGALWAMDMEELRLIVAGMVEASGITGVKITGPNGKLVLNAAGTVMDETGGAKASTKLFRHEFPINYRHKTKIKRVGVATLYASQDIVFERIKFRVFMVIAAVLIMAAALWAILLYVGRSLLSRLTALTESLELSNLDGVKGGASPAGENEMEVLENAFDSMVRRLGLANKKLAESHDILGNTVEERIRELTWKIAERTLTEKKLRIRESQQAVIACLGQRALMGPDMGDFMDIAVKQVAKTLGVEYCKILLVKPAGDKLLLRAGVGWRTGLVGAATVGMEKETQAGFTLLSQEPVIVDDLKTEKRFSGPPLLHDHGVVSGISVIIGEIDNPYGVLGAHTAAHRVFPEDDINFMQVIANILALAITRCRIEGDLLETKTEAETANRAKSEFLASMSHDLRTPLNAIMGFAELMKDHTFGPLGARQYDEYAKDIHDSGNLLLSLINDILDLSKIEAGKFEIKEQPVDVAAAIQLSVNLLKLNIEKKKLCVEVDAPPGLPVLNADRKAIMQIFNNLLSNSVKFTPEKGGINVSAKVIGDGSYEVSFADTGIGMTDKEITRSLAPFEQIDSTHSRKHEGTGLGLHLCQRLMELHGGYLEIESEVDKGTTVTVMFPPERVVREA